MFHYYYFFFKTNLKYLLFIQYIMIFDAFDLVQKCCHRFILCKLFIQKPLFQFQLFVLRVDSLKGSFQSVVLLLQKCSSKCNLVFLQTPSLPRSTCSNVVLSSLFPILVIFQFASHKSL